MIIGILYSILHLVLGVLAAVWTARRLRTAGNTDGCLVFAAAFIAFVFWPLALAVLIALAVFDEIDSRTGGQ